MKGRTYRSVPHLYQSPTYYSWRGMLDRCLDPRCKDYARYGARGITVCESWLDLAVFVADVGLRPDRAHTIDRIENSKGYAPGNCRWATAQEQQRNKNNNFWVEFEGRQQRFADLCDRFNLPYDLVYNRLYAHGWSIERALTPSTRPARVPVVATSTSQQYQKRRKRPNKHGLAGVEQQAHRFVSRIRVDGKRVYLGLFPTAAEAHAAYLAAQRCIFDGTPLNAPIQRRRAA